MALSESSLDPKHASFDTVLGSGLGFSHIVQRGETLRIVDLEGNQAVDTLFFDAQDPSERYSAVDTIRSQGGIYLTSGSPLMSTEARVMLKITADTCGRHDTLGGACAAESNQVRYALDKKYMHSCRDNFLLEISQRRPQLSKRDLTANINFFMNVPVSPEGELHFEDGISAPGRYVEMRAERDVLVLISNCPQLNNPCNGYNPTPVRLLVWKA
ncbi:MAG TPA: urea amidolyase associated protein UAAP2 [Polyangiaceae bacterium]